MQKKDFLRITIVVVALLLIPIFGTLFIDGWNWGFFDFILMGVLLYGTGIALTYATRKIPDPRYRILACVIIVLVLLVIWAEMAVDAASQVIDRIF